MDILSGYLGIDIETGSRADLKTVGAATYAEHDTTKVFCVAFCYIEGDSRQDIDVWYEGDSLDIIEEQLEFIRSGGSVVAHNSMFERHIWAKVLVPKHGFPPVERSQWRDTQAEGRLLNLPASLEGLGAALQCNVQKDMKGKAVMKKLSSLDVPPTAAELMTLGAYCATDTSTMMEAHTRMRRPMSPTEMLIWQTDTAINDRGVFIDLPFVRACLDIADQRVKQLDADLQRVTRGELTTCRQVAKLREYVTNTGIVLPKALRKLKGGYKQTETLDAKAIDNILDDGEFYTLFTSEEKYAHIRDVLILRREYSKATSLAKLKRAETAVGSDGRLRGALNYCGAHTGRWSSYGVQLHNLPKNNISDDIEVKASVINAVRTGRLEALRVFKELGNPLELMSQSLRAMLCAPPGALLVGADLSAIEARVVCWLAGQDDKLKLFARGEDVYTYTANSVGSNDRQLGKVCDLALGYGMGDIKFANVSGLPAATARMVKNTWRNVNGCIVQFWRELEDAVKFVIRNPKEVVDVGRLQIGRTPTCLVVSLPSGRSIRYWHPKIVYGKRDIDTVDDLGRVVTTTIETEEIRFLKPEATGMVPDSTYGGKLTENVTQAVARDVLAYGLVRMERTSPAVVHVHDSAAAEVDPMSDVSGETMETLLATPPAWAKTLPLAAAGWESPFFLG